LNRSRFEAFEIHGLGRKPFWVREWDLPQNELYSKIQSSLCHEESFIMNKVLAVFLTAFVSGFALSFISPTLPLHELSAEEVINRIHEKIQSVPELENWQASVLVTLFEMDKNWEPKKKTIIEKLAVVKNKIRNEKILRATEFDEDKTKDKTAKYQAEAAKLNRKNEANKGKNGERKGGGRRGMDLNQDDIFPFAENRKKEFEFNLREGSLEDKLKVYILESRSRFRTSDYYEGKYYIHPETFDVLRAELQPAKNPGPLKRLEMQFDFGRIPEGYLVILATRVRIHVGLIIKNIRMESEEIYSDYIVFD